MKIRCPLMVIALLGLIVMSCGDNSNPFKTPTLQTLQIVNDTINVPVDHIIYYQVNVTNDMKNPRLAGSFTAHGGSGNDIIVLVMSASDYTNWSNGHAVTPEYNSTKITTASFNISLGVGTHYLVYDNTFSAVTEKYVDTHIDLNWEK